MTDAQLAAPLILKLRAVRPELAPAEDRIAEVVLESPSAVAAMTISRLAERARTSQTSVLRFARRLGYAGYPGLRLALAQAGAADGSRPRANGDIDPEDSVDDIVDKICQAEAAAVENTGQQLDREALTAAADALAGAGRIQIFGIGASGLVGQDLQLKLIRIGSMAHCTSDVHLALTAVSLFGPGDVLVVVSHTGTTSEGVELLDLANRVGATSVVVTNFPGSPCAQRAGLVLLTAATETALRSGATASRIAALTIVDCLFLVTAQQDLHRSVAAVATTKEAVSGHHRPPR